MADYDWKQDPRLARMDHQTLDYITNLAETLKQTPKDQILPAFLAMQTELRQKNLHLSDSETDLLLSILTADLSPAEKQKVNTLKILAKKLAARSS